jgi:hypothetical protein
MWVRSDSKSNDSDKIEFILRKYLNDMCIF